MKTMNDAFNVIVASVTAGPAADAYDAKYSEMIRINKDIEDLLKEGTEEARDKISELEDARDELDLANAEILKQEEAAALDALEAVKKLDSATEEANTPLIVDINEKIAKLFEKGYDENETAIHSLQDERTRLAVTSGITTTTTTAADDATLPEGADNESLNAWVKKYSDAFKKATSKTSPDDTVVEKNDGSYGDSFFYKNDLMHSFVTKAFDVIEKLGKHSKLKPSSYNKPRKSLTFNNYTNPTGPYYMIAIQKHNVGAADAELDVHFSAQRDL